jgi:hypothetical protein
VQSLVYEVGPKIPVPEETAVMKSPEPRENVLGGGQDPNRVVAPVKKITLILRLQNTKALLRFYQAQLKFTPFTFHPPISNFLLFFDRT